MGAYACLELAGKWPGFFCAAIPVAVYADHFEGGTAALIKRLVEGQSLPVWFFSCTNDRHCPFWPIKQFVYNLRAASDAEVWLTSFEDTWSDAGHWADHVAYPALHEG